MTGSTSSVSMPSSAFSDKSGGDVLWREWRLILVHVDVVADEDDDGEGAKASTSGPNAPRGNRKVDTSIDFAMALERGDRFSESIGDGCVSVLLW